jgi:hypothetical protein
LVGVRVDGEALAGAALRRRHGAEAMLVPSELWAVQLQKNFFSRRLRLVRDMLVAVEA